MSFSKKKKEMIVFFSLISTVITFYLWNKREETKQYDSLYRDQHEGRSFNGIFCIICVIYVEE
jgi:hypothetical protein